MERPAVLIVDPAAARRRYLALGLAAEGYEAVPAVDVPEGVRFARGLSPAVIVASSRVPEALDGTLAETLSSHGSGLSPTLVLLGEDAAEAEDLPLEAYFLSLEGTSLEALVRRLRLVLLGRELGVDADAALESLVGDLSLTPFFELVRALEEALASGTLSLQEGEVHFRRGRIVGCRAGEARGEKAFLRLGRSGEGPFRIRPGWPEPGDAALEAEVDTLIRAAVEDSLLSLPPLRSRYRLLRDPSGTAGTVPPLDRRILELVEEGRDLGRLLDALPASDGEILRHLRSLERQGLLERQEPASGVQIVTDSTADLPERTAREHGIRVVPLTVRFGKKIFYDRVDLEPHEFYRLLEEGSEHPSSNPPPPEEFAQYYRDLVARRDVVSVHISEILSLTVENAREAARREVGQEMEEARDDGESRRLAVVDSRQVSLGLGLPVLLGARLAARGMEVEEVERRVREICRRTQVLFVVDTLEFLARGGRIGRARALLGKLLDIKPILGLVDGEVAAVDRARGRRAAFPRMLELLQERFDAERPLVVGIAHARAPVWADRMAGLIRDAFQVRELVLAEMGPVVGTHVGPGCVGVAGFQPTPEELELMAPLESGPGTEPPVRTFR